MAGGTYRDALLSEAGQRGCVIAVSSRDTARRPGVHVLETIIVANEVKGATCLFCCGLPQTKQPLRRWRCRRRLRSWGGFGFLLFAERLDRAGTGRPPGQPDSRPGV